MDKRHIIYATIEYMDTLESIRIFRRVAETKSFSLVAKELQVSQPTISKTIQGLEQTLGLSLFRRSTRGLTITVEGQKLYNSGGELIDHFERVFADVTNQKLSLEGELRISASLAFARLVIIPLLAEFGKIHPELRLNFILSDGMSDLIENNIDLALRIGELPDSSLKATKLGSFRRYLYASKSYIKKYGRPKTVAELREHKLLYYSRREEGPRWSLVDERQKNVKLVFEPFINTDGSDLMREAVVEGLGIAMLPNWMMIAQEQDKSVVSLFAEASQSTVPIYAVSASVRDLTTKQRALIDFLRTKFEANPVLSLRA